MARKDAPPQSETLLRELRDTLGRMELALGAIDEGIAWTDGQGRLAWCNEPFCRLVGAPRLKLLGKALPQVLPLAENKTPLAAKAHPAMVSLATHLPSYGLFDFVQGDSMRRLGVKAACADPGGAQGGDCSAVLVVRDLTMEPMAVRDRLKHQALAEANRELTTLSAQLEARVTERTRALEEQAEELSRQIVEREEIEARMQESQDFLKTIFEIIRAAIFVFDPHSGEMVDINAVAEDLIGLSSDDVVCHACADMGFVFDSGTKKNLLCPNWEDKDSYEEGRLILPSGRHVPVSRHLFEVFLEGREHLVQIVFDITDRKALEGKLGVAQKLESIGQLAAGIAHEINTPTQYVGDNIRFLADAYEDLAALISAYEELGKAAADCDKTGDQARAVQQVAEDADMDYLKEEIPKAISQSLEGVERVTTIVQAMKRFSHMGGDAEMKSVDLNQALTSTITVARNEWKYVADMETDFDDSLPPVRCLAADMNQVFLNVLVNAAHAIAEAVRTRQAEGEEEARGRISVSTRNLGHEAEIRIADTGVGIPEHARDKIFDPFFTTKEVGKGTGQGLTLAYDIVVEKHGGAMEFETEMGKGTTFIIRLPLTGGPDNDTPDATNGDSQTEETK